MHQRCLCNFPHHQRGEKEVVPPNPLCVDTAFLPVCHPYTSNYWIRLKGVLVTAVATDDTCLRPRHLHRLMLSQTERFNQRSCNHTDIFTAIRQHREGGWESKDSTISEGEALKSCLHKGPFKRNLVSHSHDTTKKKKRKEESWGVTMVCLWQIILTISLLKPSSIHISRHHQRGTNWKVL